MPGLAAAATSKKRKRRSFWGRRLTGSVFGDRTLVVATLSHLYAIKLEGIRSQELDVLGFWSRFQSPVLDFVKEDLPLGMVCFRLPPPHDQQDIFLMGGERFMGYESNDEDRPPYRHEYRYKLCSDVYKFNTSNNSLEPCDDRFRPRSGKAFPCNIITEIQGKLFVQKTNPFDHPNTWEAPSTVFEFFDPSSNSWNVIPPWQEGYGKCTSGHFVMGSKIAFSDGHIRCLDIDTMQWDSQCSAQLKTAYRFAKGLPFFGACVSGLLRDDKEYFVVVGLAPIPIERSSSCELSPVAYLFHKSGCLVCFQPLWMVFKDLGFCLWRRIHSMNMRWQYSRFLDMGNSTMCALVGDIIQEDTHLNLGFFKLEMVSSIPDILAEVARRCWIRRHLEKDVFPVELRFLSVHFFADDIYSCKLHRNETHHHNNRRHPIGNAFFL